MKSERRFPNHKLARVGRTCLSRVRRHEPGQMMVMIVAALVVLIGMAAIATDVGMLWAGKRHLQTAADTGAIAAATAMTKMKQSGDALQTAGQNAVDANFSDASNVTVTVNNPPQKSLNYNGDAAMVEVIVTQPQPTYFLQALGIKSVPVTAEAVSGEIPGTYCAYALDSTACCAVQTKGTPSLAATCGLISDSSCSSAICSSGGATITATNIGAVGGNSCGGCTPQPTTGVPPAGDPLAGLLPTVTVGACDCNNTKMTNQNLVETPKGCLGNNIDLAGIIQLHPGVYCGGITINSVPVVNFAPGLYVIAGGSLGSSGSSTIGNGPDTLYPGGVTFYLTSDPSPPYTAYGGVQLSGTDTINLNAPTDPSYPYYEILFYQDPSIPLSAASGNNASSITGGTTSTFSGIVYFPNSQITFQGSSGTGGFTQLIADTIQLGGSSALLINPPPSGQNLIKSDALYE